MKPTFSLKMLFVCTAFVALACGWFIDHWRLATECRQLREIMRDNRHRLLDVAHTATKCRRFERDLDSDGHEQVVAEGANLDEMDGYSLACSHIPTIVLTDVVLSPAASEIIAVWYDLSVEADRHIYRSRVYWRLGQK